MSAVALVVGTDGIVIASDGISYDYHTGKVMGYVSKVVLMPEYGAFIAATGMGDFAVSLRWAISATVSCFDDLVEQFEEMARWVHKEMMRRNRLLHGVDGPIEVSCVIGGWSEARKKYEAWRLASYEKGSVREDDTFRGRWEADLKPFCKEETQLGAVWCSYVPSDLASFGIDPAPADMATSDILARLICAARADSGPSRRAEDGRYFNAGALIQMTLLQRDSIRSWIAHRWPEDEIGKPVDPMKGERIPVWLIRKGDTEGDAAKVDFSN